MKTSEEGRLLRIFICESDRYEERPLDEVVIGTLRAAGISGATVLKGVAGYGSSAVLHTTHVLRLSEDLPMVIEAVDTAERISSVLPDLEGIIGDGLITTQKVKIHSHRQDG